MRLFPEARPDAALNPHSDRAIPTSKRDKRQIKHSLLSRLRSTNALPKNPKSHAGISKSSSKTKAIQSRSRRPNKKLKAAENLGGLLDALRDTESHESTGKDGSSGVTTAGIAALRSKPGVQKRRDKVAGAEMERFAENLAIMYGGSRTTEGNIELSDQAEGRTGDCSRAQRFAALRRHITERMNR